MASKKQSKNGSKNKKDSSDGTARQFIRDMLDSDNSFFEQKSLTAINRLLDSTTFETAFALRICRAAERHLAIPDTVDFPHAKAKGKFVYYGKSRAEVAEDDWNNLKTYYADTLRQANASKNGKPDAFYNNLMTLADYLELDETAKDVLTLLDVLRRDYLAGKFVAGALNKNANLAGGVAVMLGREEEYNKIAEILSPNGPLQTYGLITEEERANDHLVLPEVDKNLVLKLSAPGLTEADIVHSLLGVPQDTDLSLDDFDFLGKELDRMKQLVQKAKEQGEKGVNILLYGKPGGGKTELSRALAKEFGLKLYGVGEDSGGEKGNNHKRLAELKRAQALLKNNDHSMLLFDEIEDLLIKGTDSSKSADTESKVEINRLLETNPVLTVWTGNDPDKFHPAVRSRFLYALNVPYQPTLIRQKIWKKHLDKQGVKLSDKAVLSLARKYEAPPRMIASAVKATAMVDGGQADIEELLQANARITFGFSEAVSVKGAISEKYTLDLVNSTPEPRDVQKKLAAKTEADDAFALLVEAKPGAGASSFLSAIGEKGKRNVREVSMKKLAMPSAFTSPADNVRNVFRAAANNNSFLVINDIENLVEKPARANPAAWNNSNLVEVFRNTVLAYKKPFAVVSQSGNLLPNSFKRLFSHKVEMDYLKPEQARKAFTLFFGKKAPQALDKLDNLTPSHFAVVQRLVRMTAEDGKSPKPTAIVDLLRAEAGGEESNLPLRKPRTSIGFKSYKL